MVTDRIGSLDDLVIDAEFDAAVLIEEEAIALSVAPLGDNALSAVLPVARMSLRRRRPDPALERQALELKLFLVFDIPVGAAIDLLLHTLVGLVAIGVDRLFDIAGP